MTRPGEEDLLARVRPRERVFLSIADQLGEGVISVSSITMYDRSGSGELPRGVVVESLSRSIEAELWRETRSGGIGTPRSRWS